MKSTTPYRTLAVLVLCAAFLLISIPTTTAVDELCPEPSPNAWVNPCIELVSNSATVPTVDPDPGLTWDPTCFGFGTIEPVTNVVVDNIPTGLSCLLDIHVDPDLNPGFVTVPYESVQAKDTEVNDERIIGDICIIWTGSPDECDITAVTPADSDGSGIPDGLLVFIGHEPGVFLPFPDE